MSAPAAVRTTRRPGVSALAPPPKCAIKPFTICATRGIGESRRHQPPEGPNACGNCQGVSSEGLVDLGPPRQPRRGRASNRFFRITRKTPSREVSSASDSARSEPLGERRACSRSGSPDRRGDGAESDLGEQRRERSVPLLGRVRVLLAAESARRGRDCPADRVPLSSKDAGWRWGVGHAPPARVGNRHNPRPCAGVVRCDPAAARTRAQMDQGPLGS